MVYRVSVKTRRIMYSINILLSVFGTQYVRNNIKLAGRTNIGVFIY